MWRTWTIWNCSVGFLDLFRLLTNCDNQRETTIDSHWVWKSTIISKDLQITQICRYKAWSTNYCELSWTQLGKFKILSFVDPSLWTFVIFCPTRAKNTQKHEQFVLNKHLQFLPFFPGFFSWCILMGSLWVFKAEELSQKGATRLTNLIIVSACVTYIAYFNYFTYVLIVLRGDFTETEE